MSFVSTQNGSEHNAHEDSPVCRVLRQYFESLQAFHNTVLEQRERAAGLQNPLAMTGGNDVVQEG